MASKIILEHFLLIMKMSEHEEILVTYLFDGIKCYVATRDVFGKYTLYKIINDDYKKLKTANTPLEFDEIIEKDRSK